MVDIFVIPNWFFSYSIFLGLLFASINGFVAFYAFKIYRLTSQRSIFLFGCGFSLIAASYLVWSVLNFSLFSGLNDYVDLILQISGINLLYSVEAYIHLLLFVAGLITLVYTTTQVQSNRVFSLFFMLAFVAILFSFNTIYAFYTLSSILLLYLIYHYLVICITRRAKRNLIALFAFIFLFLSIFNLAFALQKGIFYLNGHLFAFIAYALIMLNLGLILKNAKKKG